MCAPNKMSHAQKMIESTIIQGLPPTTYLAYELFLLALSPGSPSCAIIRLRVGQRSNIKLLRGRREESLGMKLCLYSKYM